MSDNFPSHDPANMHKAAEHVIKTAENVCIEMGLCPSCLTATVIVRLSAMLFSDRATTLVREKEEANDGKVSDEEALEISAVVSALGKRLLNDAMTETSRILAGDTSYSNGPLN